MTQVEVIYDTVVAYPGLTASGYKNILFPRGQRCSSFYSATILRELQRMAKRGQLVRRKEKGMRGRMAWRFYLP
jgi:hypothetical protein